jgi:hypothetical protein
MKCPSCGKENPGHVVYCGYCAEAIPDDLRDKGPYDESQADGIPTCPRCGAKMKDGVLTIRGPIVDPLGSSRFMWKWPDKKRMEPLSRYWVQATVSAFRCKTCGGVFFDPETEGSRRQPRKRP